MKIIKRTFPFAAALALASCGPQTVEDTVDASSAPLNIVVIMADDLGYSDLGAYGGEIRTPALDQLAGEGVRFVSMTNPARCCPSRASLLTSHYAHNVGMGWMTAVDEHRPGYRGQLAAEIPTFAEILRDAGYRTYLSGKWHLTADGNIISARGGDMTPNGSWPTERGFDEYFGHLSGGGPYDRPATLARNTEHLPPETLPDDFYYTTAITEHAVEFVQQHDADAPMFMYLSHYAPHRPLQAPEARIAPYREVYAVGYDALRAERFARLVELGLISDDHELPVHEADFPEGRPAWDSLSPRQQQAWIEEMATYAAMVEIMDEGIGEVMDALKAQGMYENTMVFFFSDNGATREGGLFSRLAASLSNTPYRSYKSFSHSGGINSPLIVRYPELPAGHVGSVVAATCHIMDILPTSLAAAGVAYPEEFRGEALPPIDGVSLMPLLYGEHLGVRRDLFFEHQTGGAVISGEAKLVRHSSKRPWELYFLNGDPFETDDVASREPVLAAEMEAKWHQWAARNNVLPLESRPWTERIEYYSERFPNQTGRE